jgi:hypothetical protein
MKKNKNLWKYIIVSQKKFNFFDRSQQKQIFLNLVMDCNNNKHYIIQNPNVKTFYKWWQIIKTNKYVAKKIQIEIKSNKKIKYFIF